jgi:hypothetical protein
LELLAAALRTESRRLGHGLPHGAHDERPGEETDMLSTLMILSMDQGKLTTAPRPVGQFNARPLTAADDSLASMDDRRTSTTFHRLMALWLTVRHGHPQEGFGAFRA